MREVVVRFWASSGLRGNKVRPRTAALAKAMGCLALGRWNPVICPGDVQAAARKLGVELLILNASSERDIDAAFATFVQQWAGAVVVASDALFNSRTDQLATLAARHALPTIHPLREFATAGGLMSYGSSLADAYRQAGVHTGRILKGQKPADLPVQQAVKVELVINVKTAKTLGIKISDNLLSLADEVIE